MDNKAIKLLRSGIKDRIKRKSPYSQQMAVSLSIEMFKVAFNGEKTLESLAYQRGTEQGITAILNIVDEILKEDEQLQNEPKR